MNEVPLVVRRWPERGPGACHPIDGWVDGQTEAAIVYRGTDGEGDQGPFTKVVTTQREAMQSIGAIESYVNLELVSAWIRLRSAPVAAP